MGAQDRPQCHFDIEINREPGEPETGEPCWGPDWPRGRGGAYSQQLSPGAFGERVGAGNTPFSPELKNLPREKRVA